MDVHQPMDVVVDEFETSIRDLPEEVLIKILSLYIDSEGRRKFLRNVVPVCKEWKRISSAPTFWRRIEDFTLNMDDMFALGNDGLLTHTNHLCLSQLSRYFRDINADITWIISRCNDLKGLDLSSHIVSRELFSSIAKSCPNLEALVLQRTTGFGVGYWNIDILEPIFSCCSHSLTSINLDHCKLICYDSILESIAESCHSLEEFHFYFSSNFCYKGVMTYEYPKLRFPVTKFQVGCPKLRVLKVGKCYFACSGAEETEGFPNLNMFGARGSRFRKNNLSLILRTSASLVTLELYDCSHGNVFCKDLLQIPCTNVERLIVGQMHKFTSIYLRKLISQWSHTLRHLELTRFDMDVSRVLFAVLCNNPEPVLESLDLSESCVFLPALKFVVNQCPKLKDLELGFIRSLPRGFPEFFHSREELQRILEY